MRAQISVIEESEEKSVKKNLVLKEKTIQSIKCLAELTRVQAQELGIVPHAYNSCSGDPEAGGSGVLRSISCRVRASLKEQKQVCLLGESSYCKSHSC